MNKEKQLKIVEEKLKKLSREEHSIIIDFIIAITSLNKKEQEYVTRFIEMKVKRALQEAKRK